MSTLRTLATLASLAIVLAPGATFAQQNKDTALEKKSLELQKQELEVEQRKLEVKKRELETLRKELQTRETADSFTMQLQGDVLFGDESAALQPAAQDALDKVATVLAQFPSARVLIEGHSDSRGKPGLNLNLSEKRAEAVRDYLKKKADLAGVHFSTRGLGETKPIASNENEAGRQQNRRVEFTVTK